MRVIFADGVATVGAQTVGLLAVCGFPFKSRTAADLPKDGRSALQGYFSVRKLYLLATALTHNANADVEHRS